MAGPLLVAGPNPIHVRCRGCGQAGEIAIDVPIVFERFLEILRTATCAACGRGAFDLVWDEWPYDVQWMPSAES